MGAISIVFTQNSVPDEQEVNRLTAGLKNLITDLINAGAVKFEAVGLIKQEEEEPAYYHISFNVQRHPSFGLLTSEETFERLDLFDYAHLVETTREWFADKKPEHEQTSFGAINVVIEEKKPCQCPSCSVPFDIKTMAAALQCHKAANSIYFNGDPIIVHISVMLKWVYKFQHLLEEKWRPIVIGATWLKDVMRLANRSYDDVKQYSNEEVADIVWAITPLKAKTQEGMYSAEYYDIVSTTPMAPFVKICERLANVEFAIACRYVQLVEKFRGEKDDFKNKLMQTENYYYSGEMFKALDEMLKSTHKNGTKDKG